jgi:hypothetical protein
MWVRIRATHDGALIFKYLNIVDVLLLAQFNIDAFPFLQHFANLGGGHLRHGQIMFWRETEDFTCSSDCFEGLDEDKKVSIEFPNY